MTYAEADLVPLSALQHYMYCPRQCALIHVEQVWVESGLTAEGRILHDRVDAGGAEKRRDVKRAFGLPIRCLRLGLVGKADVVEFHRQAGGRWLPYPVEHKRGRRKREDWDRVQVCAQALCLEEMLGASIPAGAIFYGETRHRLEVVFDAGLRRETEETARRAIALIAAGRTPPPVYEKRCKSCSLLADCLPKTMQKRRTVESYMKRMLGES